MFMAARSQKDSYKIINVVIVIMKIPGGLSDLSIQKQGLCLRKNTIRLTADPAIIEKKLNNTGFRH